MWPRTVELMIGVWLAASPLLFAMPTGEGRWLTCFTFGGLVVVFSCLSFWDAARHARFGTLAAGLILAAKAYFTAETPPSAPVENEFLVGLLLAMFAIVPNEATLPPRPWRRYVGG